MMELPVPPTDLLFLDIECVPGTAHFDELQPHMQELWKAKSDALQRRNTDSTTVSASDYYATQAGIYSEFGKIVCITIGILKQETDGHLHLHLKSFYGHDEPSLLQEFGDIVQLFFKQGNRGFCGHNIKEFDIPYICRRMIINNLPLPKPLQLYGRKPWETRLFDTLEMWRFGDNKAFTSLKLLCGVLGVPTPKDDLDGSQVAPTYWQQGDIERIRTYCQKDVLATVQVFLRMYLQPTLPDEYVHTR